MVLAMSKTPYEIMEQRLLRATGEIIREWAFLEYQLFSWLQILTNLDQFRTRMIWFSFPNFRARDSLLQRLSETYLDDASLKRFRSLLNPKISGQKKCSSAHAVGHH